MTLVSEQKQLLLLKEISRAVNSSLILEDIFESLADVLSQFVSFDEATIVILDDTRNGIKNLVRMKADGDLDIVGENNTFAGYDPIVDQILKHPDVRQYEIEELPAGSFILSGSSFSEDNTLPTDQTKPSRLLVVPLINKGIVIGLVAMTRVDEYAPDNSFSTEDISLMTLVAEPLAVAVENAKFYWQTQINASREFLINQLTRAIRESLDINTMLATAVQELGKVTGVSRCSIQYFPPSLQGDSTEPNAAPTANLPQNRVFQYHMPGVTPYVEELSPPFEVRVFSLRKSDGQMNPFVLNHVSDCPETLAGQDYFEHHGIQSLAVFPIQLKETLVGAITLHQCDTFRVWINEDIELLTALAEHLGVALHQAQLFMALENRKATLEKTLEELQQAQMHLVQSEKMAVIGQFVAGIAHEVNTPLGVMMSNNATLTSCLEKLSPFLTHLPDDNQQRLADTLTDTMASLLNINRLSAERIEETVRNFRNFARLDESERKTVNLHESLESTLVLLKTFLDTDGVTLQRKYDPNLPAVSCFPGLLNQVLMNLLVNATHAMEGRPTKVATVQTVYLPETRQVQIKVSDTGKGIDPANLGKIFDPGFTTKGVGVGTGLGLALCYQIVEKHGGKMLVDSTVGVGTTFTVLLPM